MDGSENTISKAGAETKTSNDQGKEDAAERSTEAVEGKTEDLGRILEPISRLESVVKPYVEEFTQAAKSLVENVTEVGKEV